jgi:hypothetical protein
MQSAIKNHSKSDGLLLVAGYYGLLGTGFILSSLVMAVTAIPHTWQMSHADFYTFEGLAIGVILMMAGVALLGLVLGAWMLTCAFGLWSGRTAARRSTILLSALVVGMCVLSIPVLLYSYGWRDATLDMLLTVAGLIGAASAFSAWYLMRPAVKASFD